MKYPDRLVLYTVFDCMTFGILVHPKMKKSIAINPARGGSKRVPNKNIEEIILGVVRDNYQAISACKKIGFIEAYSEHIPSVSIDG